MTAFLSRRPVYTIGSCHLHRKLPDSGNSQYGGEAPYGATTNAQNSRERVCSVPVRAWFIDVARQIENCWPDRGNTPAAGVRLKIVWRGRQSGREPLSRAWDREAPHSHVRRRVQSPAFPGMTYRAAEETRQLLLYSSSPLSVSCTRKGTILGYWSRTREAMKMANPTEIIALDNAGLPAYYWRPVVSST